MNEKQAKKIRKTVSKYQNRIISNSWDVFFESINKLKFRYRLRLAWLILINKKLR